MERGVLYFVAGTKHNVHAVVSIASLRKWWRGPVAICTEAEGPGRECAEWIARDDALNIPGGPVLVIPDAQLKAGGGGRSYFSKTFLPKLSPFEETVFLDADTLVVGDFSDVWPRSGDEAVLTRFCDWVSTGGRMQQRIRPWGEVNADAGYVPDPQQVERVAVQLSKPWPAINTGVMGWLKGSWCFNNEWHRVTSMRRAFIVDETACQIIFPEFRCRVLDDRFNCSVVYPPAGQTVEGRADVRIWHGHGGKFWKRPSGQRIWLPHYRECLEQNRANIQAIAPHPKFLRQLPAADQQWIAQHLEADALPAVA
jgi:hypothetical protein